MGLSSTTVDSGEGVASLDGGSLDGGSPDDGSPDGGLPDGGLPDDGLPDDGSPDGGLLEGGSLDGDSAGEDGPELGEQRFVVLDIGGEVGALVLYTPADLDGAEIEISLESPADSHTGAATPGHQPLAPVAGHDHSHDRRAGPGVKRTHSIVRERRLAQPATAWAGADAASDGAPTGAVYAAVYPGLPAGVYTIWRDAQTPAGTVRVEGGQAASWQWEPA